MKLLNSNNKALTKIQALILVSIIVVATSIGLVYYLLGNPSSSDTIKIGVCADLDNLVGKSAWEGVVLAAEQINDKGGVLGRTIEVIAEDSDSNSPAQDVTTGINALTKLISYHKVDFIISPDSTFMLAYQDVVAEHKKILFGTSGLSNEFTQRVLDDYQRYKYFFRTQPNATHALLGLSDCIVTLREYSGFNKVAFLFQDIQTWNDLISVLGNYLPEVHGFEVVYQQSFPTSTIDFSSYFADIESSGAEILVPLTISQDDVTIVKEWYDRESPFVIWGFGPYIGDPDAWEFTESRCEYATVVGYPTTAGYPLTNQTIPFRDAYFDRWDKIPNYYASLAYDTLRYILYDALERAGTTETEAVIAALEKTKIETSLAKNFVFTSSHDVLGGENINNPEEELMVVMLFQWQNGIQVPMYPKTTKEEAGATYMFPDWPGPWD